MAFSRLQLGSATVSGRDHDNVAQLVGAPGRYSDATAYGGHHCVRNTDCSDLVGSGHGDGSHGSCICSGPSNAAGAAYAPHPGCDMTGDRSPSMGATATTCYNLPHDAHAVGATGVMRYSLYDRGDNGCSFRSGNQTTSVGGQPAHPDSYIRGQGATSYSNLRHGVPTQPASGMSYSTGYQHSNFGAHARKSRNGVRTGASAPTGKHGSASNAYAHVCNNVDGSAYTAETDLRSCSQDGVRPDRRSYDATAACCGSHLA